ncbi:MAG TPA: ABC transporter permease [Burkholderiaceae bacterium]|nr:ABC transporter permease [Burkholderiaceae bacterium]
MRARLYGVLRQPLSIAALAIVVLLAAGELLSPGFVSQRQLVTLLKVAALLGVVAAGQNLVILGGREGIDLSVGGMVSFTAFLAGNLMQQQDALLAQSVVLVLGVGLATGLLSGLGVTLLRIPPLVMTLGMLGVVQGGLVLLTRGVPSGRAAPALTRIVNEPLLLGVPGIVLIWALIGVALTLVLRRTTYGFNVYAIGTNEAAAALAGVPVRRTRALLYALSGFFAAVAGILLLGYTEYVFVGSGDQYMLPSIIAVVIGGTSLAGGSGGYVGTMAGAIVLVLLQSILTTLNIPPFGRQIVYGLTLLALMLLYGRQRTLRA